MEDCIFCKIYRKEIPKEFTLESKDLMVFEDIHPSADIHLLIVPKEHMTSMNELKEEHAGLLLEIYQTATKLARDNNLENDLYRIVVNGGRAQHVPHLHFHFLGGQWLKMV